jgi:uncharacterized protein YkwD
MTNRAVPGISLAGSLLLAASLKVTIRLPADANLEILNRKLEGSGEVRKETIIPAKDAESLYNFKATWTETEQLRTVKRSLRLKPGDEAEVDLNLELSKDEQLILKLINAEREKEGLKPLQPDHKMNRAARSHSLNMAKHNVLTHSLDGKGAAERLADVGYWFRTFGENCGMGSRSPAAAVQMWLNSAPHKENILTAEFTETGIGIAVGRKGVKFYTQVFGTPAEKREGRSER